MSYTFKYYPDPGITYDIIRMLYVKLNACSIWKETLTTIDYREDHIRFIEEHAKLFPEPNSDLSLFFFIPSNKRKTFLSSILEQLITENFSAYSISDLITFLNNTPHISSILFSYYLGEHNYNARDFEYHLRSNKTIPDKIKLLLFGFHYNPETYTSKLCQTIYDYYLKIVNEFSTDQIPNNDLIKYVNLASEIKPSPNTRYNEVLYSLCRCTPRLAMSGYSQDNFFFISTSDTISEKVNNKLEYSTLELLEAIHSLDDQYRLEIIQLLKSNTSLTPLEISEKLKLSLTATKYHLSILKKTNIIMFKRINRTTYYSYNSNGFKSILKALENFEKGEYK